MNDYKLINGDCLEVLKDIPDGSIDAVICDPPYGTTACKWDSVIPFEPIWTQLNRVTKDNGAIALFGSEPFSSALRMSNIQMFKYDWIWDKKSFSNFANVRYMPAKEHEIISIFYKKLPTYNPIRIYRSEKSLKRDPIGTTRFRKNVKKTQHEVTGIKYIGSECQEDGKRCPRSILEYPLRGLKKTECGLHPTQKPVALLEYLIKTYTNKGETVLDFTMGSGSTGIACLNTNRRFIGIELDKDYFKIAKDRIENHQRPLI